MKGSIVTNKKAAVRLSRVYAKLKLASALLGSHDCFEARELTRADEELMHGFVAVEKLVYDLAPEVWERMRKKEYDQIMKEAAVVNNKHPGALTPAFLAMAIDAHDTRASQAATPFPSDTNIMDTNREPNGGAHPE